MALQGEGGGGSGSSEGSEGSGGNEGNDDEGATATTMSSIPMDLVIVHIFPMLDQASQISLGLTCKGFYQILQAFIPIPVYIWDDTLAIKVVASFLGRGYRRAYEHHKLGSHLMRTQGTPLDHWRETFGSHEPARALQFFNWRDTFLNKKIYADITQQSLWRDQEACRRERMVYYAYLQAVKSRMGIVANIPTPFNKGEGWYKEVQDLIEPKDVKELFLMRWRGVNLKPSRRAEWQELRKVVKARALKL